MSTATLKKPFVTIVSGLPRSGTSMMMRMLEAGGLPVLSDNLRQPDEDNPNGYYEFEISKQRHGDKSWLADAPGKAVKIIYMLLFDMPPEFDYKVLFMRRDLEEVIASQEVMLRRKGLDNGGVDPEQMARMFRDQLDRFYAWVAAQPNFELIDVQYAETLADPLAQARRIDAFLGLGLDVPAMARVCDPSLHRQRRGH